jgi:hypothetical protein
MSAGFRIDTHVHLLIDKLAEPDAAQIRERIAYAADRGLRAVCIMEHLDAAHYARLISEVFVENRLGWHPLEGGVMMTREGVMVFSGAEVSLHGGADVGVHAAPAVLLSLNRAKGHYTLSGLRQALQGSGQEFLIVAHHVLLPGKHCQELYDDPSLVDALEIPGKVPAMAPRYRELSHVFNLPVVSGSDAHVWVQIGVGCAEVPDGMLSDQEPRASFFNLVRSGGPTPRLAPDGEALLLKARELRASLAAKSVTSNTRTVS